ncbi:MAG: KUP/HAK/KT family potassium transporter, partial [Pseudomonadota bacterium]
MRDLSDQTGRRLAVLSLAALGVVYGDIGTSPLYTMKEVFNGNHPIAASPENVLGILSMIFWSLILVVLIKYVIFIMRADNRGEGGIMALTALALRDVKAHSWQQKGIILCGIFGAAMFYGDGIVTPAMSVISAIEGLEVANPAFRPFVIPITLLVLLFLFCLQRRGTAHVGAVFGPIMLLWFSVLAILGVSNLWQHPQVLLAVNPSYAVYFLAHNLNLALIALGGVVLSVTGAEALYADMGHFGRRPISLVWFYFVLPCLLLNYFGQGALII